jgi:hypothetical protein
MEKETFKITGLRPLLMCNPVSMLDPQPDGVTSDKKEYDPKEEAERRTYKLPTNGQLYLQSLAFRGSVIGTGGGASGRKIGKFTANSRFSAGVFPLEENCPLYHPETEDPIFKYEIDSRRAIVNKAGIIRHRPKINEWACDLKLEIDTDLIKVEQVLELLNISGRVAGVGDYRIQKKGLFGKYKAEIKRAY